jgi:KDO2-lipid IV(A) lauroyltransferase
VVGGAAPADWTRGRPSSGAPPALTVAAAAGRGAYLAYRAGAEVARIVPAPVGVPAARWLGRLAPSVLAGRRRQVERNLRRVHGSGFSGLAMTRAVAATFDSYTRYFYELFLLPDRSRSWIEAHVRVLGMEHVRAAIDAGRGLVVALPHLGNWDLAGAWLASQGYRVTVVAEEVEPPELFDWFVETRRRLGMRVIGLSAATGGEVVRALRANEVVCLLADRDLTGDGVTVEFFGERTTMPGGPALVALRAGAPLVAVGCYFRPRERMDVQVVPVSVARVSGVRADVERITQSLAATFEDLIRVAPENWHLMQPNWPSDHQDGHKSWSQRYLGSLPPR